MSSAVHVLLAATASSLTISNLEPKLDVHGSIVTAHDGTYRRFGGYWYYHGAQYAQCHEPAKLGCDQTPDHCGFHADHNVSVWRSPDLSSGSWEFRGHAALCAELPDCKVMYRPHLVRHPRSGAFVLFVNYVRTDGSYGGNAVYTSGGAGSAGGAGSPEGPFALANPTMNLTRLCPGPAAAAPCGEAQGGAGDFDVFVDPADGAAYIIYGSQFYMSIEKLTPDFLDVDGAAGNASIAGGQFGGSVFPEYFVEAPVLFERQGTYYAMYGHCCCFCHQGSGAVVYTAKHPMGPWAPQGNGGGGGGGGPATELACRPAADPMRNDGGYAALGRAPSYGACRDGAGAEPAYFANTGAISADECAAQCTVMGAEHSYTAMGAAAVAACAGFSYCTADACAGSCHLYVYAPFPAPDRSNNWAYSAGEGGDAKNVSTTSEGEPWWRCYTPRPRRRRGGDGNGARPPPGRCRLGDDTAGQGCLYGGAALISTTRSQQNFVIEVHTRGGGTEYVWTGDRWQQAPDGIKGNEGQFWAPLNFSADGTIQPIDWVDSFTVDAA